MKVNDDGSKQTCNLPAPTAVSRFVAIDAKKRKHEETKELTDDNDGSHQRTDVVSVKAVPEKGTAASPDVTAIATISPNTPPKGSSDSLADKQQLESNDHDEAGAKLQFGDGTEGHSGSGSD